MPCADKTTQDTAGYYTFAAAATILIGKRWWACHERPDMMSGNNRLKQSILKLQVETRSSPWNTTSHNAKQKYSYN